MSEMNCLLLCNPFGTDVSTYMSPTGGNFLVGPIMKGTMLPAGRELYTFGAPYQVNVSSAANITALTALIQTKLSSFTPGHVAGRSITLFGYSQGCEGIAQWYNTYGAACPIDPLDMRIVMIGCPISKYGGFITEQSVFANVGYIHAISDDVKYPTTIIARQYDGVGDFPTASAIHAAYNTLTQPASGTQPWNTMMAQMAAVLFDGTASKALWNAIIGMLSYHNAYQNVTIGDPKNVTFVEPGKNITYLWSPNRPALGGGVSSLQDTIESQYARPCGKIPPTPRRAWTSWFQ